MFSTIFFFYDDHFRRRLVSTWPSLKSKWPYTYTNTLHHALHYVTGPDRRRGAGARRACQHAPPRRARHRRRRGGGRARSQRSAGARLRVALGVRGRAARRAADTYYLVVQAPNPDAPRHL